MGAKISIGTIRISTTSCVHANSNALFAHGGNFLQEICNANMAGGPQNVVKDGISHPRLQYRQESRNANVFPGFAVFDVKGHSRIVVVVVTIRSHNGGTLVHVHRRGTNSVSIILLVIFVVLPRKGFFENLESFFALAEQDSGIRRVVVVAATIRLGSKAKIVLAESKPPFGSLGDIGGHIFDEFAQQLCLNDHGAHVGDGGRCGFVVGCQSCIATDIIISSSVVDVGRILWHVRHIDS
mmetsp:Transcript_4493/g.12974  ORF Transcript_4493/g.12974 Transcript_4493/m.12974 type:complete len:239 (+) Transcript_4493:3211-3927(+)